MQQSKAIVLHEFNSLDGIKVEDHELEILGEEMIEVNVEYCGVNFADFYTIHQLAGRKVPLVLGNECSGIVTNLGSDSLPFKIGDKVICYDYKGGLHRSIVRINHEKCYKILENIDLKTAAAIFVNYLTAWFALFDLGDLKDGDIIFVSSCAGGVGLAIVELVKIKRNITIYGTAGESKRDFLESIGVKFVEYSQLSSLDQTFDLVIESMNTETRKLLSNKLNPFGKVVIIGAKSLIPCGNITQSMDDPNIDPVNLIYSNSSIGGLHIGILADDYPKITREALNSIFKLLKPKNIKIKIYPFEDAKSAYEELAKRSNIGKILLQIQ